jgi:thiol-disulfide isomerase/thioredoxin
LPALLAAQANNYPNGSTVANFTVTDTEGNVHTLYDITASGKYVVLDFFFDTCPPCQQTQPYFNELHETYGCNAADLFVMSINNGTDNNAQVIAYENTYGGNFHHSPAVSNEGGGGTVNSAFGVNAFPTYCLVGPDNKRVVNDIWPISNMQTYVNAFPPGSGIQPAACAVGIDENSVASFTDVYPVPSTGIVTLNVNSHTNALTTVQVLDVLGKQVMNVSLTSSNGTSTHTLDLSGLSDGHYILKLTAGQQVADQKRIILAR